MFVSCQRSFCVSCLPLFIPCCTLCVPCACMIFWFVPCLWVLFHLPGFTHISKHTFCLVANTVSSFNWRNLAFLLFPSCTLHGLFCLPCVVFILFSHILPVLMLACNCACIFLLGTSFLCNNFHTFCFYALRLSIPAIHAPLSSFTAFMILYLHCIQCIYGSFFNLSVYKVSCNSMARRFKYSLL